MHSYETALRPVTVVGLIEIFYAVDGFQASNALDGRRFNKT